MLKNSWLTSVATEINLRSFTTIKLLAPTFYLHFWWNLRALRCDTRSSKDSHSGASLTSNLLSYECFYRTSLQYQSKNKVFPVWNSRLENMYVFSTCSCKWFDLERCELQADQNLCADTDIDNLTNAQYVVKRGVGVSYLRRIRFPWQSCLLSPFRTIYWELLQILGTTCSLYWMIWYAQKVSCMLSALSVLG